MDTRVTIFLLAGLLLALTCPTNCDEDASLTTNSTSVQETTSASTQSNPSTSTTIAQEVTHDPPQNDPTTIITMAQESTDDPPQNDTSAFHTTVQAESNTPSTVLATTSTQLPTTTTTTTAETTISVSEVHDTDTLAPESGTSQHSQEGGSDERNISTTSTVNLSTKGAGSTVASTDTERLFPSTSVASTFATMAGTTETTSTSTAAATTSSEATTRHALTTQTTLPETSATLDDETTSGRLTTTQTNINSHRPTDGTELSPSQGVESMASSASPIPGNQQTITEPAELTTSTRSPVTFATPNVSNSGERGTTLPSENYTSESPTFEPTEGPNSEPSTGKTGSSECSYQRFLVSVVLSVLFINLVFCILTSFCVYRVVTKHHFYSWDPPPIRYGSVDYGISMGRRNMGLDLSPETPDGIPPPPRTTHEQLQLKNRDAGIPIVITNEDGWCVPYSEDSSISRAAGEQGQDGTRKTNGNASNISDVDTGL